MAEAQNQSQAPTDIEPPKSLSLLAQERYGSNFHGDVKQDTPPADNTPPVDDNKPDDADTGDQPPADTGDDHADEGGEGEAKPADAKTADEGDEGDEVATVSDLISHLETDPEWFSGLGVDVTVNGQTTQVPFRDLVANYQMNQAADARLEQAKTKSAEAQQALAQKNAALEAQFATAGAIIDQAEKILTADFEQVDWKQLHEEDPGAFAATKVAYQERQNQIAALKQNLIHQYQESVGVRQQEFTQNQQQFMQEQFQLLQQEMPKVSPDWGSEKTLPAAKARLSDYLLKAGFSQEDINSAADHRLLVIAEKARLHDEARGKLDVSKKRLRKVPKVIKPGTPKPQSQVNTEQINAARSRLAASGSMQDAVAVLRAKRK